MTMQALYFIIALVLSTDINGFPEGFTVVELSPDDDWKYLRLHGYVESQFPSDRFMGKVIPTQKGRDFANDLLRSIKA